MNMDSTVLCNAYILVVCLFSTAAYKCTRDGSTIVRNVILEKMSPAYRWNLTRLEMPKTCPFFIRRDIFFLQEEKKVVEGANRWKCDICGKAFLTENFINRHFDNRHKDWIREGNDTVCLSDYCDIFRCDILSGYRRPDFWDVALCLEDDMHEVFEKCMDQMKLCVPRKRRDNSSEILSGRLRDRICSYLTCKNYWNIPEEERHSDGVVALYIICSILVTFGLLVYYCIFYQYFYTDAFADSVVNDSYSMSRRHEYASDDQSYRTMHYNLS